MYITHTCVVVFMLLLTCCCHIQRVKEAAGEASTSDEDDERSHGRHAAAPSRPRQVYDKEQEALRSSFLQVCVVQVTAVGGGCYHACMGAWL